MIPIGSPQAHKIIQDDRRLQLVDDLHLHMEKALEIASELQFAGKDLANAFLDAYVDYDLTGFVAVIYEYAANNALMPEEYYSLKQLQYAIAQAVNTVNQEAAHE